MDMNLGVEERRLANEAIATLIHIKSTMADLLLKPAGVPAEIYRPLPYKRNESTGRPLSKREMAPLILDAVEKRPDGTKIIAAIVKITAHGPVVEEMQEPGGNERVEDGRQNRLKNAKL